MTTPTAPADLWAKLYCPPPPQPQACTPDDMHLFTFDTDADAKGLMNRKVTPRVPRTDYRAQITAALRICAGCPLATREWCIRTTTPRQAGATIVAGGVVFNHGRAVWSLREERGAAA